MAIGRICSVSPNTMMSGLTVRAGPVIASMQIKTDDLAGAEVIGLLEAHLDHCRASSPPESVHALDLDGLRARNVTFWSI